MNENKKTFSTSKKKIFVNLNKIINGFPKGLIVKIIMLVGKRSNGKSFTAKEHMIKEFINSGSKFVLVRRNEEDFKKEGASKYWRDVNEEGWIKKWTKGMYEAVTAYGSNVYLGNYTDKGRISRDVQIGDYYPLSTYIKTKSVAFPSSYKTMVYEEMISDLGYLDDEPRKFLHMMSTVFRERDGLVIMIGNSIDTNCPYFDEWGIDAVHQKDGTTEIYNYEEIDDAGIPYEVNIAVNVAQIQDGGGSHMMFGNAKAQISGQWASKSYTHPESKKYKLLYRLAIVNGTAYFYVVQLVKDKNGMGVRVYQSKKNENLDDTGIRRIIYVNTIPYMDTNPYHTSGFNTRIPAEKKLVELLKDSTKVGYTTNLCASAFNNIIKQSMLLGVGRRV